MERSPWEAKSLKASQLVPRLSWNPNFHNHIHKSPSLFPILSQMHSIHAIPPYFLKIHSSIMFHIRLCQPRGVSPEDFPTKSVYAFFIKEYKPETLCNIPCWILCCGVVSPSPNPQVAGPHLVGCPRLFIQYILSYPPYSVAVSSFRNPRKDQAVVTGTHKIWWSCFLH